MPGEEEIAQLRAENVELKRQIEALSERVSAIEHHLSNLDQGVLPKTVQMERKPVESSLFNAVGYNPLEKILELDFKSGEVYHYYDVPPEVYQSLLKAESLGQFFHSDIDGVYTYRKVP